MTETSKYFVSLDKEGKIAAICDGFPAHELTQDQVGLTQDEWRLVRAVGGDLFKARSLLHEIEKKLKAHKKELRDGV